VVGIALTYRDYDKSILQETEQICSRFSRSHRSLAVKGSSIGAERRMRRILRGGSISRLFAPHTTMKIVLVIHGYPMRYNAGSEVYTQALAQALANHHEVHVFSRQQNKFIPDYALREEVDPTDPRIVLHLINLPHSLDQYRHRSVDEQFGLLLDRLQPDLVHIGHLNHLSTSLVFEAHRRGISLVFTLHDYWLMCPRGQFLQVRPHHGSDLWPLCTGQQDCLCAERCYARFFQGQKKKKQWILPIGHIGCIGG